MPIPIEIALFREKVVRDDAIKYVGDLLIRQRLVNEAVVGFGEEFLAAGSRVIDACAGPEGSWLASAKRGYRWIGNDVCLKFSETLRRTGATVVLSDFSQSPFRDGIVDGIFFIFALNNICNPIAAFHEASRMTNQNGVILEAEPGLSTWISKILLHSLLSESGSCQNYLQGRSFSSEIEGHFATRSYSEHDYANLVMQQTLGKSREEMASLAQDCVETTAKKSRVDYKFHEEVIKQYFTYLEQCSKQVGFNLAKAGILAIAPIPGRDVWEVSKPVKISTNTWLQDFIQARKWDRRENPVVSQLPTSMDKSPKRMVVPILCFKKNISEVNS